MLWYMIAFIAFRKQSTCAKTFVALLEARDPKSVSWASQPSTCSAARSKAFFASTPSPERYACLYTYMYSHTFFVFFGANCLFAGQALHRKEPYRSSSSDLLGAVSTVL